MMVKSVNLHLQTLKIHPSCLPSSWICWYCRAGDAHRVPGKVHAFPNSNNNNPEEPNRSYSTKFQHFIQVKLQKIQKNNNKKRFSNGKFIIVSVFCNQKFSISTIWHLPSFFFILWPFISHRNQLHSPTIVTYKLAWLTNYLQPERL